MYFTADDGHLTKIFPASDEAATEEGERDGDSMSLVSAKEKLAEYASVKIICNEAIVKANNTINFLLIFLFILKKLKNK